VLSYLAGRSLSREEIWTAMELPRSTYYDQLDKGTLITADNLRVAAANLGINRAELLTRYRFIEPEEVTALAEEIRGGSTMHAVAAAGPSLGRSRIENGWGVSSAVSMASAAPHDFKTGPVYPWTSWAARREISCSRAIGCPTIWQISTPM